uniref:ER membrane protein complex subunit 4 n=1 Tax=Spermophilus dauricus TaxID=99837 RepID=A0A8C9PRS8_SPEDA
MFNPQHHKERKGWVNLPTPAVELSLPGRGCRGPGVQGLGQEHSLYPVHYLDKQVLDTSVQETDRILVKGCDVALSPLRQIPRNLCIMFIAGNAISTFTTRMVRMMAW